ncbi:MAG TPA: S-layer homology domain-containing protein [Bacillota bacterium]
MGPIPRRRQRTPRRLLIPVLLLMLVAAAPPAAAHRHEEPYRDIAGHWAEPWIEVLWEEGVTDGFSVRTRRGRRVVRESRFLPDRQIELDAWTVLNAKVFQLTPLPGRSPHRLASGQEVGGWLAAALAAGWLERPRDWWQLLEREDAVRFLLEALDLGEYARQLPRATVDWLLERYRDHRRISSSLRPYIAAATRLGIIEGYPDRTFQPQRKLTRAEAAALLGRSALARAHASPNPFYPDGDGIQDETRFTLSTLRNRNLSRWLLVVEDDGGKTLWSTGTTGGRAPAPPPSVAWDGRNHAGVTLAPGTYFYRLTVWDRHGRAFTGVRKPLVLGRRYLLAGLNPNSVRPEQTLTIWANTEGGATRVTAAIPGVLPEPIALSQQDRQGANARWSSSIALPVATPPGPHAVLVQAQFPGTSRSRFLTVLVLDPVQFEAQLEPFELPAGSPLHITAWASTHIDRVVAEPPGAASFGLTRKDARRWQGTWYVPIGTPPGDYQFEVTGYSRYGPRSVRLPFRVSGDRREALETILTD